MTARLPGDRPAADPRHPHWCGRAYCELGKPLALGYHRSPPITVAPAETYLGARSIIWLSQTIDDRLDESTVFVNLRVVEERPDGEVVAVATYSFGVVEAGQAGSVMALLAKRGAERRYIGPEDWR